MRKRFREGSCFSNVKRIWRDEMSKEYTEAMNAVKEAAEKEKQRRAGLDRKLARAKFKVKIKSLMEEARIIRKEENKFTGGDWYVGIRRHELHWHRVWHVRNEQRSTFIAYAFFRGDSYRSIEKTDKKVDVAKVTAILRNLARMEVTQGQVDLWLNTTPVSA